MRFLSKIRERQFAKKWGGAYNLSRAVLAGVLAAGCLMPGFAEAASFNMDGGQENTHYTISGGNTATITQDISGSGTREIYWKPGYPGASVEGCTINVNNKNIEPDIKIEGGYTSKNGAVTYNTVTISGNTTFKKSSDIYGGWSQDSGDVTYNTVTISDNTTFGSTSWIYGGKSSSGNANNNAVEISGNTKFISTSNIYGGFSSNGTANDNQVIISGGTFKAEVYGGKGNTAEGNSVKISGGTFKNIFGGYASTGTAKGNSVIIDGGEFDANVYGGQGLIAANGNSFIINAGIFNCLIVGGDGYTAAKGNSVEINGGTINADVSGGYAYSKSGEAYKNSVSINGGTFNGDRHVQGGYSKSGTANENSVSINGGTFNGDVRVWGGLSDSGNANGNSVSISGGTFNDYVRVWGGLSNSGTANGNSVSISGGKFYNDFYGGKGEKAADENRVIISGGKFSRCWVYGGYSESGTANRNQVIISDGTFDGNVVGGSSVKEAKDNKIVLLGKDASYTFTDTQGAKQTITGHGKINITGTVQGGLGSDKTTSGNEIHVYGTKTIVGGIDYFNELNFHIDNNINWAEPMLIISGAKSTSITKDSVAITFDGNPQDNATNKSITLVRDEKGTIEDFIGTKDIDISATIGATLTVKGTVALNKEKNKLIFTLADNTTGEGGSTGGGSTGGGSTGGGSTGGGSTGGGESGPTTTVNENGKSLVETRAAAAFVVNNMSDFMLGQGMEQAKAAAGGVVPIDEGKLTPFAAVGGSNMRYTTGSYVDVNGWNGAVGFAKQADKLLFGVAVEHGRGNYDSYLDNGVHASGDIKSTGGVIFGEYKLDNGVHYDAALRAGRVKSDYNSTATSYDESSTYYGFSLGGGKELTVSDKATLDVYGRYYFSHTNGSDVSIATGEEIDFDAVNSHRLRIGGRYTTTLTEKSKAYAGLAWQYEFGGDAKAAINGYSAPTPSLQGHSAIVEAGYKLNAGKNLTLDFNLNGAMGKQRGIGGGIGAQWLF